MNKPQTAEFQVNLLRAIAAHLNVLSTLQTAREMFGKSYFSLGAEERKAAEKAQYELILSHYYGVTHEVLANAPRTEPIGFCPPTE